MIENWQTEIDQLIEQTWAGQIRWQEVPFKKVTPKKSAATTAFQAENEGRKLRFYSEYHFSDVTPMRIVVHLEVLAPSGEVLWSFPPHESLTKLATAIEFKPWEIDESQRNEALKNGYLIRFEGTDWKVRDVFYEEPGFHKRIGLDQCSKDGVYFWGGTTQSLAKWTVPLDVEIAPDKQKEIVERIINWGKAHDLGFRFGRGITEEESRAKYIKKGWTAVENPNGTWTYTPPNYRGKTGAK
jgi:hypothetical protein